MTMPRLNAAGTAWERNPWQGDSPAAPVQATSGDVANASAVATLPAVAGKTNYISGFEVFVGGATAGSILSVTVAGIAGGSRTFAVAVPTGATLSSSVSKSFDPPLPATGANVAITATLPAAGAGNTRARVDARGYSV